MINNRRVVATIEGRMTSTRLPGKIMMPLCGKPVMQHMIERHRRSKYTDEVVVATTTNKQDDPVIELCEQLQCRYFRGSEDDVLSRIVGAGTKYNADILVQGMADSPMVDWRLVDKAVEKLAKDNLDCATNEIHETYPIGFDTRCYSFAALLEAEKNDKEEMYREHAGYSIRSRPEKYKVVNFEAEGELRWSEPRLTLDTKEDYEIISKVYDALYPGNPDFSALEVVRFLRANPELLKINAEIVQKVPEQEHGMA